MKRPLLFAPRSLQARLSQVEVGSPPRQGSILVSDCVFNQPVVQS